MAPDSNPAAVSFDLFGTLIETPAVSDYARAIRAELIAHEIAVPTDWDDAFYEKHIDAPEHAEVPLADHVYAALQHRGIEPSERDESAIEAAVLDAFDTDVDVRDGAFEAIRAARTIGPIGVLSNCSVPQLAERSMHRAGLDPARFDAIVTSVACGWRKPSPQAFYAIAEALDVRPSGLLHVGDNPDTDGGVADVGGEAVLLDECGLYELAERLGR